MSKRSFAIPKSILLWIRVGISLVLALLGLLWLNEENFPWWVNLLVMSASYLVIAYDIIVNMLKSMIFEHQFFEEETLMVLASLGAFALRFFGPESNEYFEGVLVILLFQIGEFFEDLAEEKSRQSIRSTMDLREQIALVRKGDDFIETPAKNLQIGDIVLLRAGEKCPCDGVISSGIGYFDESSLTGEAMPLEKQVGDPVYSGTIFLFGQTLVRVEKEYENSTVSHLLAMVENGAKSKSKATRFLTRFSRIYTPVVTVLATLLSVLPPLIMGPGEMDYWRRFLYVGLNFLVVSCPCAIVISVPLAYFAGIGRASKHGILVKGASFFDVAESLRLVAFDKTGTLTNGMLYVERIVPIGMNKSDFISAFLIGESISNHPIANAFRVFARNKGKTVQVEKGEEIAGRGANVLYQGHQYEVLNQPKNSENACPKDTIGIVSYLVVDGVDQGYAVFADSLKENAKKTIEKLHRIGVETLLLSGDKEANVERVSWALNLDSFAYELTPEGKFEYLKKEKEKNKGAIAFIGDGINDAPSLSFADIGVAMGGLGSDLAMSSADVLLMTDDPLSFVDFLHLAHKTKRRAIACISFALTIKVGLMILSTIAGFMGTWSVPLFVSVLGDTGVTLFCVLLAISLFWERKKKRKREFRR